MAHVQDAPPGLARAASPSSGSDSDDAFDASETAWLNATIDGLMAGVAASASAPAAPAGPSAPPPAAPPPAAAAAPASTVTPASSDPLPPPAAVAPTPAAPPSPSAVPPPAPLPSQPPDKPPRAADSATAPSAPGPSAEAGAGAQSGSDAGSGSGSGSGSDSEDEDGLIDAFVAQTAATALEGLQPAGASAPGAPGGTAPGQQDEVDYERLIHLLEEEPSDSGSEIGDEQLDALAWSAMGLTPAVRSRMRGRKRLAPDDGLIPSEALPPARIAPRPGYPRKYKRAVPLKPLAGPSTSGSATAAAPVPSVAPHASATDGDGKKLQCQYCGRVFNRAYNLSTHEATHDPSKAKRFQCPYRTCQAQGGRTFSRKHDLQRHVASAHEFDAPPEVLLRPDGSAVPVDYDSPWDPPPKKKRGRPRKVPLPSTTTAPAGADSPASPEQQQQQQAAGVVANGLNLLGLDAPSKKFRCDTCGRAFVRRDALRRHACSQYYWPPAGSALRSAGPGRPRKTPLITSPPVPPIAAVGGPSVPPVNMGFGFMPNPGWFYGLPPLPAVAPASDGSHTDSSTDDGEDSSEDSSEGDDDDDSSSEGDEDSSDDDDEEDEEEEAILLAQQATASALSAYHATLEDRPPPPALHPPAHDASAAPPPVPAPPAAPDPPPPAPAPPAAAPPTDPDGAAPTLAPPAPAAPAAPADAADQVQAAMAAALAAAEGMWSDSDGSEDDSGSEGTSDA